MQQYLSNVLRSLVDEGMAVGMSAMVTVNGKEIFKDCCGCADLDTKAPFAYDTICRIYSMTKIVTAVAAMILYERGMFRLEDPVKAYLPGFRDTRLLWPRGDGTFKTVPTRQSARMRHLLTMTVGLPYYGRNTPMEMQYNYHMADLMKRMNADTDRGQSWNLQRFANELGAVPMLYEPGTGWSYGLSADILGAVIEVISGMSLGEFFRREIFEPLGMTDTGFVVPPEKAGRKAVVYDHTGGTVKPYVNEWLPTGYTPGLESAGEGLYSTLGDYTRFLQMLALGGTLDGVRILGRRTIENMATNHVPPSILKDSGAQYFEDDDYGYGFLVSVKTDNTITKCYETPGSFWWGGVAGTIARVDPKEKMTTVIMMQHHSAPQPAYVGQIMQTVYAML